METFVSFVLAAILTFVFVRQYLKRLTAARAHGHAGQIETAAIPCPRCDRPIPKSSTFCSHCGAALALWKVHRAAVQAPSAGEADTKPKPRPVIDATVCMGCGGCVHACPEAGALDVVNGKSMLVQPELCTGQAKCADACPTGALKLAFGNALQTVRVPRVSENFESNVEDLFIVGELGGMGMIKTAINEGKLVIDFLKQRLDTQKPNGGADAAGNPNGSEYDILIVGSGPAGLSAALSAHQYGLRYLVLEQGEIASTIRNYPRHKFLMAEPVAMPLYGTLYIADSSKEGLLAVWETIIANTGVRIQTQERAVNVRKNGGNFLVTTPKGEYHARSVVLAMGKRGTPRRLGVPGEDLAKVSYNLIEAESYEGKDILVVGGGDSAIEAALALARDGRNRVTLSYRGADFQKARDRNQAKLGEAEREGKVRVLRKAQLLEIAVNSVKLSCGAEQIDIPNDFVFIMIGGESPEEFLRKTGVEIVEKAIG